jgi:uncharacterized protein (DUF488 family)
VHPPQPPVWTIGHSTRSAEAFDDVLLAYGIGALVDVRRYPGSRRLPQFASAHLEADLQSIGISYRWIPALGGRRRPSPDSPNTGWTHPAFRAYADHIATEEFAEGLFELLMIANGVPTAIMCAELLWWKCHRRVIADVLTYLGSDVVHIRDRDHSERHVLRPPAHIEHGLLTYV